VQKKENLNIVFPTKVGIQKPLRSDIKTLLRPRLLGPDFRRGDEIEYVAELLKA